MRQQKTQEAQKRTKQKNQNYLDAVGTKDDGPQFAITGQTLHFILITSSLIATELQK
jgi:hypothetical protein